MVDEALTVAALLQVGPEGGIGSDTLFGPGFLLGGKGEADDARAALGRRDGEAAPAAADFEEGRAVGEVEAVQIELPVVVLGDEAGAGREDVEARIPRHRASV